MTLHERQDVSNHRQLYFFPNILIKQTTKKTWKILFSVPLCGEFTGGWWIPHYKGHYCGSWRHHSFAHCLIFLWSSTVWLYPYISIYLTGKLTMIWLTNMKKICRWINRLLCSVPLPKLKIIWPNQTKAQKNHSCIYPFFIFLAKWLNILNIVFLREDMHLLRQWFGTNYVSPRYSNIEKYIDNIPNSIICLRMNKKICPIEKTSVSFKRHRNFGNFMSNCVVNAVLSDASVQLGAHITASSQKRQSVPNQR